MNEGGTGWPPAFADRMEELLGGQLPAFLAALKEKEER